MPRTVLAALAATLLVSAGGACAATPHYAPSAAAAGTYYVSPGGDDSADGSSPGKAWRSLARADQVKLRPGDKLLLQGGARFPGTVTVGADEAGEAGRPVVIGSYGTGRARIDSADSPGVSVHNTAGVDIRDLTLRGRGAAAGKDAGVNLYSDRRSDGRREHVSVSGVDVSGFRVGIAVGATEDDNGFKDVSVRRTHLHDNRDAGLLTYGADFDPARRAYAHENVDIEDVEAYENHGDPAAVDRHTGDGIILGGVRGATLRNSSAHDNGGRSATHATAGPVGLWAYDSTRVLIEHSSSYRNHTRSTVDGSGFGFDSNVSDSKIQYNVSYENDGSGYYVFSRNRDGTHTGNTIRYNISTDDARKLPLHGALTVYGKRIQDLAVYQNTVVMSHSPGGRGPAVLLRDGNSGVSIRNNILVTEGDPLVSADAALSTDQVVLQGNVYHTTKGEWAVKWGDRTYSDLAAWRAGTGQERVGGKATGAVADPCFAGGALPGLRTPEDAGLVVPGCPRDGLDLHALFGTDAGGVDYFGRDAGDPPAVGAVEP
ncbi:right-handed parallel beta-helix repeat-containing protein [Streptomyces sp. NPDC005301]|uniref:right-handed parallel beta-helix repeat-containing protein n=1 Tax=Streptomyces sp. NPDC005301 TaxID=3156874 RepID=UPI0033B085B9